MRKLLFLFLFVSSSAFAQQGTHRVSEVLTKGQGTAANLVPFAKVRVCAPGTNCQQLATVYSDINLTQVLSQPITADANANYNYYVAPGCFDEQYSAPSITTSIRKNVCSGPTAAVVPGGNNCNMQFKGANGSLSGDTGTCTDGGGNVSMSTLTLAAGPTANLQAATKKYVDDSVIASTVVPGGNVYNPQYTGTDGKFNGDTNVIADGLGNWQFGSATGKYLSRTAQGLQWRSTNTATDGCQNAYNAANLNCIIEPGYTNDAGILPNTTNPTVRTLDTQYAGQAEVVQNAQA